MWYRLGAFLVMHQYSLDFPLINLLLDKKCSNMLTMREMNGAREVYQVLTYI